MSGVTDRSAAEAPRGEMTADQFLDWLDSHPPLPRTPDTHLFMEPCGQFEGTDSCWFCGRPDAEHPRTVR